MDTNLVKKYSELKAAEDDIRMKKAAAEARLEDARTLLAQYVGEVQALGFSTVADLQAAIEANEAELRVLLEDAENRLREGGYTS